MVARSNTLSNMRYESAFAIFDLPADYFLNESGSVSRDTIPEIQRMLGHSINDDGVPQYQRMAPILCLNDDPTEPSNYFLTHVSSGCVIVYVQLYD